MSKTLAALIKAELMDLKKGDEGWVEKFDSGMEKNWPKDPAIDDPFKGGILWVSQRDQEVMAFASVSPGKTSEKKENEDKRLSGEVVLSRAMFNSRFIRTNQRRYRLISFEAPLMRKKEGKASRAVACDLIALSGGDKPRLVAVEVKCKSGQSTDLDYALLEARYYGLCLNQAVDKHRTDLNNQMVSCLRRYHDHHEPGIEQNEIIIEFAVAAPESYFREQLKDEEQEKENNIRKILKSFKGTTNPGFAGFWVLPGEDCLEKKIVKENKITIWPSAGKSTTEVWLPVLLQQGAKVYNSIGSLKKLQQK